MTLAVITSYGEILFTLHSINTYFSDLIEGLLNINEICF